MKIRLYSDLHFEFHQDGGRSFLEGQDSNFDVLVLAGDINTARNLKKSFSSLKEVFKNKKIVFVPGNHEYYHSSFPELQQILVDEQEIIILDNSCSVIDGVKFVGTTLWFQHSGSYERGDESLNDFTQINNFRSWVGKKAQDSIKFLDKEIEDNCIVITHHLPHRSAIHPHFAGSYLNKYFVNHLGPLVEDRGAKFWFFGHTHSSIDIMINKTRLICNPFGYHNYATNYDFDPTLTLTYESPKTD